MVQQRQRQPAAELLQMPAHLKQQQAQEGEPLPQALQPTPQRQRAERQPAPVPAGQWQSPMQRQVDDAGGNGFLPQDMSPFMGDAGAASIDAADRHRHHDDSQPLPPPFGFIATNPPPEVPNSGPL
jgi:hypothetical protein